ncbi:MAG: hypothetical protein D6813_08095, partial [Calditrichaeota bacterium]
MSEDKKISNQDISQVSPPDPKKEQSRQEELPEKPEPLQDESSREDFKIPENPRDILEWGWTDDEERWRQEEQAKDRKHKRTLLEQYKKRLRNAESRKSKLGLADSQLITIDSEIEECTAQIKKLEKALYGSVFSIVEEDQLLQQKQKQVSTQSQLGSEINEINIEEWFNNLELRDKFFVITLSIFNGIKYPDFKDINEILLAEINANFREEDRERRTLASYFEKSDIERLKICRAEVCSKDGETEEIIRFIDDTYPNTIFDLLRKQYHDILLDLLPALKKVVEQHQDWEIRFWAALAVAKIGKINFSRIESQVLDPWATDKRAYVRAATGYPLAYLAEDKSTRDNVRKLLNRWSDPDWSRGSDIWRYRWTASSTYKQIGLIGQDWARDWAYEGLKQIASYDDIRLLHATIDSLVVLSLQGELEHTLFALKNWISEFCQKEPDGQSDRDVEPQYLTTLLAFIKLCEIHTADPITESNSDSDVKDDSQYRIGNILSLMEKSRATSGDIWQLAVNIGISTFK